MIVFHGKLIQVTMTSWIESFLCVSLAHNSPISNFKQSVFALLTCCAGAERKDDGKTNLKLMPYFCLSYQNKTLTISLSVLFMFV